MSLGIKRKLEILLAVGFACYIVGSIRLKRKICHFNCEKKGNPIAGCFFMKKVRENWFLKMTMKRN